LAATADKPAAAGRSRRPPLPPALATAADETFGESRPTSSPRTLRAPDSRAAIRTRASRALAACHPQPRAQRASGEGWRRVERETGIEPATNSLEGCDSTTELLPPFDSPSALWKARSGWAFLAHRRTSPAPARVSPPFPQPCPLSSAGA